jgi:hypothetical protein
MCCERTTDGLKAPEDGLNTNRNTQQQDLVCQQRNTVYCMTVGKYTGSLEHLAQYVQY